MALLSNYEVLNTHPRRNSAHSLQLARLKRTIKSRCVADGSTHMRAWQWSFARFRSVLRPDAL